MENDDRYAVPDDWEEAADDSAASQHLQQKIEATRIKHLQQNLELSKNSADMNNDQQTRMLTGSGTVPVFKILKRPESSGELVTSIKSNAPQTYKPDTTAKVEPSSSLASSDYGAVQPRVAPDTKNDVTTVSNQARTLEERVMAYAQARERIFGVVDQGIHEELPIVPKLIPRTTPATPSITPTSTTNK